MVAIQTLRNFTPYLEGYIKLIKIPTDGLTTGHLNTKKGYLNGIFEWSSIALELTENANHVSKKIKSTVI